MKNTYIFVKVWLMPKRTQIAHRNLGGMHHSGKNDIKKYCNRKYFISRHRGTRRVAITVISEEIVFPL